MLAGAIVMAALVSATPILAPEVVEVRPQAGPQEAFLFADADIVIAGGAAGGGKTWALLMEPLRHRDNGAFGAVIFRRTYPQIKNEGGLWDEAAELYMGAEANSNDLEYRFPSGMTVAFKHLQHLKDAKKWTGAQVPLLEFDQLEEFEEGQFWYLLTRNRSARAGVRPYLRATCNPVPEDDPVGGWLNKLIAWWWDPATGYAIPERSGVVRWFVRLGEELHWDDSPQELLARFPGRDPKEIQPKSITFIPAMLSDNPILERNDPGYRAWLMAQPLVERERLLGGNWKIKATKGKVFNREWFRSMLSAIPADVTSWVRYWDKAGTQDGGKYTAGVLMGKRAGGRTILANVVRGQWSAHNRETIMRQTAEADRARFGNVTIWTEQEPGSGGKESAEATVRNLAGFAIHADRVTGDKVTRAGPFAAQVEAGNIDLLVPLGAPASGTTAPALEAFLSEAQNFDGSGVCDQIDSASGAFNKLHGGPGPVRFREIRLG
jgi:predicted phage terminase large subunit-like protein